MIVWMIWITEPFVTKSSMVIHHYKPECPVRKMGCYLQGQGHSNWVWVHSMKNHDYFYYMFWIAEFLATNLVWQCMFISWSVLWKGCFAIFKVKVTVKVLNFSECLPGQYLWSIWSIKLSMVMHHQPGYHTEIFCYVQGQRHNRFSSSSEILKLLQPKLDWWYIITRQGNTPWKDFLAFTQGVRQRIWIGWLWARLLPLLAIPISKAGVNTSFNQENVERTLLL